MLDLLQFPTVKIETLTCKLNDPSTSFPPKIKTEKIHRIYRRCYYGCSEINDYEDVFFTYTFCVEQLVDFLFCIQNVSSS